MTMNSIKIFTIDYDNNNDDVIDEAYDYYNKYQVLLLRSKTTTTTSPLSIIRKLYKNKKYRSIINETFTIENKNINSSNSSSSSNNDNDNSNSIKSEDIFDSKNFKKELKETGNSWYCSFIVQNDDAFINDFLRSVPCKVPPVFGSSKKTCWDKKFHHTSPIWLFIGQHLPSTTKETKENLSGRKEHTDSVTHAGTWHYQVSGKKVWFIRPLDTDEWKCPTLIAYTNNNDDNNNNNNKKKIKKVAIGGTVENSNTDNKLRLKIECSEGDILFINTRLWWHSTEIPNTSSYTDNISCSYARDFHNINVNIEDTNDSYTNVDGLYSTRRIRIGDIVLTESELPDCELPRSDSPNCEIAESEDGTGLLVAIKNIQPGDFFSVAPSDDDDDDNDDDDNDNDDDNDEDNDDDNDEDNDDDNDEDD